MMLWYSRLLLRLLLLDLGLRAGVAERSTPLTLDFPLRPLYRVSIVEDKLEIVVCMTASFSSYWFDNTEVWTAAAGLEVGLARFSPRKLFASCFFARVRDS